MSQQKVGEVTIVCLTDSVHLHDIGVHLTRGHRTNVSTSVAAKSKDLAAAKSDRTVSIHNSRAAVIVPRTPSEPAPRVEALADRHAPPVEFTELIRAVVNLTEEIIGLRRDLSQQRPQPVDVAKVFAGLEERLRHPVQVVRAAPASSDDPALPPELEEVFIPSNLTGGATATELKVSSETAENHQLTGTAAALKAARRKR